MQPHTSRPALFLLALVLGLPVYGFAQAPASSSATAGQTTAPPRQSGTVKAVTPHDLVLTTTAGQDIAVTLPPSAKILLVDPVTHDVKNAQPGSVSDIAGGDKAVVIGTAGDTSQSLTATRVLLLKSGAIAAMHAQEQAAWARSLGGIVKMVDSATGTITAVNGTRTLTITATSNTVVRRYAGGSVRFEDAVKSTVAAIQPGDQVQARGERSPEGTSITADEIVTGSFSNFSGLLTAVDPGAGTVTLKDLATKKTVTVALTGLTNLRKLPPGFGQGAGGMHPGAAGPASPGSGTSGQGARPSDGSPRSGSAQGTAPAGGGGQPGAGASGRPAAARMDLSRIIGRLPTETSADLKAGDAVMIVASNNQETGRPTAITLLSGVEQILAASPAGQTTLSPWSLGGGEAEGGGGGEGGPGR